MEGWALPVLSVENSWMVWSTAFFMAVEPSAMTFLISIDLKGRDGRGEMREGSAVGRWLS